MSFLTAKECLAAPPLTQSRESVHHYHDNELSEADQAEAESKFIRAFLAPAASPSRFD